jgi:hypothetical protein
MERITDLSRTLRHVRVVPGSDIDVTCRNSFIPDKVWNP